ncbi:integrase [Xanthobacter sp. SG618]|uniref:tyrosine-type recombinase/integrase n=1 Tax=Xanthobacter sp. SG618 TaxID=2587121 RepID=UPI0017DA4405|nr:site-specific integrase [Xanthobacter sp. SG618]NMN56844.1 integrase [Xanthobacter sp. SG618]
MPSPKSRRPNERIKRKYLDFQRLALGRSDASISAAAEALHRFEHYTSHRDFKRFHIEQAKGFRDHLAKAVNARTGEKLSAATVTSILTALKRFFAWLAMEPGYRRVLTSADADYFTPTARDARIATARRERPVPSLEQVRVVLERMPAETDIEKRDRALLAFLILTGARDGALITFKLKHLDMAACRLEQDARDVATKRAKTFFFFPVGDDIKAIVAEWVRFLRTEKLWGENDPLFPATKTAADPARSFHTVGLARQHWSSAGPVRKVVRAAFEAAGQPYANPHSFRNTLVQLAYKLQLPPEAFKAWSQNLGHEDALTTFTSYGTLPVHRQGEVMRGIAERREIAPKDIAAAIATLAGLQQA